MAAASNIIKITVSVEDLERLAAEQPVDPLVEHPAELLVELPAESSIEPPVGPTPKKQLTKKLLLQEFLQGCFMGGVGVVSSGSYTFTASDSSIYEITIGFGIVCHEAKSPHPERTGSAGGFTYEVFPPATALDQESGSAKVAFGACAIETDGNSVIREIQKTDRTVLKEYRGKGKTTYGKCQRELKAGEKAGRKTHLPVGYIYLDGQQGGILGRKGRSILVMERVPGRELFELLHDRHLALSYTERLLVAREVVRAVMDFHARGMVHFDIKPENIMFDAESGMASLIDFSGSQQLGTRINCQTLEFTPGFEAPEVYRSFRQATHARSVRMMVKKNMDYCAVGATLAEIFGARDILSQKCPSGVSRENAQQHYDEEGRDKPYDLTGMFVGLGMPEEMQHEVRGVIESLTAEDPAERPESLGDVMAKLDACIVGVSKLPEDAGRLCKAIELMETEIDGYMEKSSPSTESDPEKKSRLANMQQLKREIAGQRDTLLRSVSEARKPAGVAGATDRMIVAYNAAFAGVESLLDRYSPEYASIFRHRGTISGFLNSLTKPLGWLVSKCTGNPLWERYGLFRTDRAKAVWDVVTIIEKRKIAAAKASSSQPPTVVAT